MVIINKKDLIKICSERTGYTQKTISDIYEIIFDIYKTEMMSGKPLTLSGFGNMQIVNRKSKNHRHPVTGETIDGKEYKTVYFSPTPAFMKQINETNIQLAK